MYICLGNQELLLCLFQIVQNSINNSIQYSHGVCYMQFDNFLIILSIKSIPSFPNINIICLETLSIY